MLVTSHPATRFLIFAEVALLSSSPLTVAVLVEVFISYIIPSSVQSSAHKGNVATKHTNNNSHWWIFFESKFFFMFLKTLFLKILVEQ